LLWTTKWSSETRHTAAIGIDWSMANPRTASITGVKGVDGPTSSDRKVQSSVPTDEVARVKTDPPLDSGTIATLHTSRVSATAIFRSAVVDGEDQLGQAIRGRPAVVVISPTVWSHFGRNLESSLSESLGDSLAFISMPGGEQNKTQASVTGLLEQLSNRGLSRDGILVGIGGGVLLDVVGFTASQYRRGIAHTRVGTTLVAQVDAAVGLKCGVNVGRAKNLAGAFHPAEAVLTDSRFLETLAIEDVRCGLAEMVKLGVATDAFYFAKLEAEASIMLDPSQRQCELACELVDTAIRGMVSELNVNPYEHDLRRRVDAGHTISPHLESTTDYKIRHGEAVAIDLAYFAVVSSLMDTMSKHELHRVLTLLRNLGLPIYHPALSDFNGICGALDSAAAHRGRKLRLPLPTAIGATTFLDHRNMIPDHILRKAAAILERFEG